MLLLGRVLILATSVKRTAKIPQSCSTSAQIKKTNVSHFKSCQPPKLSTHWGEALTAGKGGPPLKETMNI